MVGECLGLGRSPPPPRRYVRLTNSCESANFAQKTRKLQRTGSEEPNPFEATVIALSTSILDFEISSLFQYLVVGTSVEYDESRGKYFP